MSRELRKHLKRLHHTFVQPSNIPLFHSCKLVRIGKNHFTKPPKIKEEKHTMLTIVVSCIVHSRIARGDQASVPVKTSRGCDVL